MTPPTKPNPQAAENHRKLLAGIPLHFDAAANPVSRRLPAEWIREAATKQVEIDVSNAEIEGNLDLSGRAFEETISLINCRLIETADLSYASFKKNLVLRGSSFEKGITFQSSKLEQDLILDNAAVGSGKATFSNLRAEGVVSASRTVFGADVKADFAEAYFEKSIRFWGTEFGGDVEFDHCHIAGSGNFGGVVFKKKLNFNPSRIDGGLFFNAYDEENVSAAIFEDSANFGATEIGTAAVFDGATFKSKDLPAQFFAARIDGPALFTGTTFAGPVDFNEVEIEGSAYFQDASFEKSANFERARIAGSATYQNATFAGLVQFARARIGSAAVFDNCKFTSADADISFYGATIEGDGLFRSVQFSGIANFSRLRVNSMVDFGDAEFKATEKEVLFYNARIGGDAYFRRAKFAGDVSFLEAEISGQAGFSGAVFSKKVSFNLAKVVGPVFFRAEKDVAVAHFAGEVDCVSAEFGTLDLSYAEFTAPDKPLMFDNMIVSSDALARGAVFTSATSFRGVQIKGAANFNGVQFKGDVTFGSARIDGEASFSVDFADQKAVTTFAGVADFAFVQFGSNAVFNEAEFLSKEKGLRFHGTRVGMDAYFRNAKFDGYATFNFVSITGNLTMTSVEFRHENAIASFDGASIGGGMFFYESGIENWVPAIFAGEFHFIGGRIGSHANFQSVQFNSTKKIAWFDGTTFGSTAYFSGAVFKGITRFVGTQFEGLVEFVGTRFDVDPNSANDPGTLFVNTEFKQGVYFNQARFSGPVDFRSARFDLETSFVGVEFKGTASFNGCYLSGSARFGEPKLICKFSDVSFRNASFTGDAHFEHVIFMGLAQFRETSFRVVSFSEDGLVEGQAQFQGNLEFGGCTYERIQTNWQSLMRMSDGGSRLEPYDRQPYMQLESVFRSVGRDLMADEVYLERQRVERTRYLSSAQRSFGFIDELQRFGKWLFSYLYWRLLNYGVRPYRMVAVTALLLLIGTGTFLQPDAVNQKGVKPDDPPMHASLRPVEAFQMSLKQFLPVDLPMASQWSPSEDPVDVRIHLGTGSYSIVGKLRASVFATFFLKLPGWILVPLGVAALTGLLRSKARS